MAAMCHPSRAAVLVVITNAPRPWHPGRLPDDCECNVSKHASILRSPMTLMHPCLLSCLLSKACPQRGVVAIHRETAREGSRWGAGSLLRARLGAEGKRWCRSAEGAAPPSAGGSSSGRVLGSEPARCENAGPGPGARSRAGACMPAASREQRAASSAASPALWPGTLGETRASAGDRAVCGEVGGGPRGSSVLAHHGDCVREGCCGADCLGAAAPRLSP